MTTIQENKAYPKKKPALKARTHASLRWLHLYSSMLSLLLVLFFSVTGITLNHPDWLFGTTETTQEYTGTLPSNWQKAGQPNQLEIAEFLRATHKLKGRVTDFETSESESSLTFKAPGYAADTFINMKTGTYTTTVVAQGAVAVMNDLHKGRYAGSVWAVFIDVSSLFLILISVTGIGLMVYLKKVRLVAIITIVVGGAAMLLLMRVAFA